MVGTPDKTQERPASLFLKSLSNLEDKKVDGVKDLQIWFCVSAFRVSCSLAGLACICVPSNDVL